ncbi:methyltransferase domain-containing protein [Aliiruegeria sabulilitoris]|uniref:methyltransferase domain-containing protein n=1 Tax=Aliiruegeria sabulilitoris TaxID=1510458 RepID=UPI0012E37DF4|nr:methyltransferase domain-containing protein [Aliiruegeria sabulilitoris]NDR55965.1 methyltransferase domain-containing protein [Pseudoruegeria sp. M32A2M]
MNRDWNPESYLAFNDLRLRPALDLLSAIPALPNGDVIDLGCGAGTVGPALASRFQGHRLVGIDLSDAMLEKARRVPCYDRLERADIAGWVPDRRPALIFSNAALQWVPEHGCLLPGLFNALAPGGVVAIQMPRQHHAPAQEAMRALAQALFPDRFDFSGWQAPVASPEDYALLLSPLGTLSLWETTYFQRLDPSSDGHPVRLFSQSTAARSILEKLSETESEQFLRALDARLAELYPRAPDGSVLYPFRRIFMTVLRQSAEPPSS